MKFARIKKLMTSTDFIKRFVMGLIIGVASIVPGLSGGVIAAAAGIYEPSVNAIVSIRRQFKRSAVYLFPIGTGVLIGLLLFSRVVESAVSGSRFTVIYIFIGLVIGSLPSLIKESNAQGFRKIYLIPAVIAFAAIVVAGDSAGTPDVTGGLELNVPVSLLCGAVLALGTIIPGISSSFIFMYMGVYEQLLSAVNSFDIKILAISGVGLVVTALLIIKLVEVVFRRFHGYAYYAVLGFLSGTMVMVFPGVQGNYFAMLDFALLITSAAGCFLLMRLGKKPDKKDVE
ncbi:MAG: DUF368 domain-containing protein [Eubacteriales bacterium]